MADFTAKDVQALRQSSGAGMMDAKRALVENGGDAEAATRWLRERGLAQTAKRADRANMDGAVAVAIEGDAAALVELKSETDYVAKSAEFTALVDELARAVAAGGEQAAVQNQDRIDTLKVTLKENIELGDVVRFEPRDGAVVDSYLHRQDDRGVVGVLVELADGDRELAHDVALHVAAMQPAWVTRDEAPDDWLAAEREVLETRTRNEGKPEQAIPKIVEGRLTGLFKERGGALVEQPFVRDPKQTVGQLLGSARVTRFARVAISR